MPRHQWQYSGAELRYQFESDDYVEEYDWAKFDPHFASADDLEFQALSLEEQFRRLPKGIVCNEDNALGWRAVEKMLIFMGEAGVNDPGYVDWCSDNWAESWRVAKRFNECIERKRWEIEEQLGYEEVERIKEAIAREKEEAEEERERVYQAKRAEVLRQKELDRQRRKAEEQERVQREEEEERRRIEEEARNERWREIEAMRVKTRQELAQGLRKGGQALRQAITKFTRSGEVAMRRECEALGRKIGRFIRLFARRLKESVKSGRGGVDWWVVQAAVEGVIDVAELVFFSVEIHNQRNSGVRWSNLEVLNNLRAFGVREAWGESLFKLFFEAGIGQQEMVRWVRNRPGVHGRLKLVVYNMAVYGMGRMPDLSRAFSF
ncbi:hypothetical protein B0T20DRAFT_425191 [Sordaria brevicollis]|uniref:Uncharacterized protein n=1 Tax=Sordaria brevicollis TaxID=83679 RepID=A0AAE0U310_SORBR|nr:hypothetical protein B0T20DRAFT_425191 [Sordaria brevicollis]